VSGFGKFEIPKSQHYLNKIINVYKLTNIMNDIKLELNNKIIKPNSEIKGSVAVNYPGRFDGIVINAQIIGSNKLIVTNHTTRNKFLRMYHDYS